MKYVSKSFFWSEIRSLDGVEKTIYKKLYPEAEFNTIHPENYLDFIT